MCPTRWYFASAPDSGRTKYVPIGCTRTCVHAFAPVPDPVANGGEGRAGAAADAGWRRHARSGLYAVLQPTLNAFLNPKASEAHTRSSKSLPALHGRGRLGVRINLFQGDLDLDVHLEGRGLSAMRGRTFHPPTGLLVLPAADARVINPSGTLDLVVEAGARTARIHLAYENLLARTELILGSMVVPTYPLQGRRFRFGVHWPIFD